MREIRVDNEHWYQYIFTAKTYLALIIAIIPAGAVWLSRRLYPDEDVSTHVVSVSNAGGSESAVAGGNHKKES